VQDSHFTFSTTVEPPVDVDQKLPTTPEDFNSMISKVVEYTMGTSFLCHL